MLRFYSSSARVVNSRRAIHECLEAAFGDETPACDLLVIHASIGHKFKQLAQEARKVLPNAQIVGASCCGVVGREGVSESMKDVAIMAVQGGDELAVAHVDGIDGRNAFERSAELGRKLKDALPDVTMVYLMAPGIDIANDRCVAGLESVLGDHVTICGATSSDNMKGLKNYQIVGEDVLEHAAFAIGFADPTLKMTTGATHGFVAVGEPMVVTAVSDNRIEELNHRPAWEVFTERLGLDSTATCEDTIPVGALAEKLSSELAEEYGNTHVLRAVTSVDDGALVYPTCVEVGTELWLTVRDEERIFSDMDRLMERLVKQIGDREVVAVFHADCLARGRLLLNRVMKEELVGRMQTPLMQAGEVPPWLGMYGFGEFARLGGLNTFHNYTTALYVVHRA